MAERDDRRGPTPGATPAFEKERLSLDAAERDARCEVRSCIPVVPKVVGSEERAEGWSIVMITAEDISPGETLNMTADCSARWFLVFGFSIWFGVMM